jgi:GH15 family glucan-1,4-alpha-glucosidase
VSLPLEDYAMIGDGHTVAIVGKNGSIDWLCLPRFDSPSIFTRMLGGEHHGYWQIAPAGGVREVRRRYRDDTLVLETDFETEDGEVRIIDLMPMRGKRVDVLRIVEGRGGRVPMRMDLALRFDYGNIVPFVTRTEGRLLAVGGPDAVLLETPVQNHGEGFSAEAGARLRGRSRRDREVLAQVVVPVGAGRDLAGRGPALAHHPEGPHLCPHRRQRRRPHHVAARKDRWGPQLGLPLLLAA